MTLVGVFLNNDRYYFAVSNTRKGVEYTFRILNFYKRTSMYNSGLRPLLYSEKLANSKGEWCSGKGEGEGGRQSKRTRKD
jgi:hypothetical protein